MLTHARIADHGPDARTPVPYDGSTTGMAADVILLTPLTVQQNVPNLSSAQTNPKTQVNPTLEQGDGRAPGWQWGWMKKVIPYTPTTAGSHKQRHFGPKLRAEQPRASAHPVGTGPGQSTLLRRGFRPFAALAEPTTVYHVAAHSPLAPWAEPI